MDAPNSFEDLIDRVRAGDKSVVRQFVEQRWPRVLLVVRRLPLRKLVYSTHGSIDFAQMAMISLLQEIASGKFDVRDEERVFALLERLVRKHFSKTVRAQKAACRDVRRNHKRPIETLPLVAAANPDQQGAYDQLAHILATRVSPEERALLEGRAEGRSWSDLGASFGITASAARMRYARIIRRLRDELKQSPQP